jgi:hypothetical protein
MRPRVLAALAIALLATATPAAAAPRLHGVPVRVRGGSELHVTWGGLGQGVHEAELELSLAGGRWVRISPELDAHEGGFTWRVPSGLSGPARLRLRYGGEGFEAEGDVSMPFVLEAGAGATASRTPDPALDEWWCVRNSGAMPLPHVSGRASLRLAGPTSALVPEPDRMMHAAQGPSSRSLRRASLRSRCDDVPHRVSVPRSYPLRI